MKYFRLAILFLIFSACKKENKTLVFSEVNIFKESTTVIEINIPKVEGKSEAVNAINSTLTDFVCSALQTDTPKEKKDNLEACMLSFNEAYADFNSLISDDLQEELPTWEVLIDGEVIYNTEKIVCIAMNSSINTGAANSNFILRFFNFDPKTGNLLGKNDLLTNLEDFTALAEEYYHKEINSSSPDAEGLINDKQFTLPEDLGFSEEGVIILYDNFHVGAFEKEIIEFTIPYEVANDYLKI